jgi:hypothetical protein
MRVLLISASVQPYLRAGTVIDCGYSAGKSQTSHPDSLEISRFPHQEGAMLPPSIRAKDSLLPRRSAGRRPLDMQGGQGTPVRKAHRDSTVSLCPKAGETTNGWAGVHWGKKVTESSGSDFESGSGGPKSDPFCLFRRHPRNLVGSQLISAAALFAELHTRFC